MSIYVWNQYSKSPKIVLKVSWNYMISIPLMISNITKFFLNKGGHSLLVNKHILLYNVNSVWQGHKTLHHRWFFLLSSECVKSCNLFLKRKLIKDWGELKLMTVQLEAGLR